MRRVLDAAKGFGLFWYGFVIGDDWTIAALVAAALLATWGLLQAKVPAWWLPPAAVVVILTVSLERASHRRRP
jgi:uncharacterized membrane protein